MRVRRFIPAVILFLMTFETPPAHAETTENLFSAEYGKLVLEDSRHVLSSPAGWNQGDWIQVGLGAAAVAATAAWADEPFREEVQRHRHEDNDRFAKEVHFFGLEYSFAVLGAFEAAGLAFDDDRAKQTAHDGLSSSIIATGIITSSLKLALGRGRPDQIKVHHFSPFSGDDSFPSGHATQAFAVASVIAEHYDPWWVKVVSYGTASLVGYSRMENDSHWASDVLAGALIGTAVGKMVVHFNSEKRHSWSLVAGGDRIGVQSTRTF